MCQKGTEEQAEGDLMRGCWVGGDKTTSGLWQISERVKEVGEDKLSYFQVEEPGLPPVPLLSHPAHRVPGPPPLCC